jgi:hypothetical protein
MKLKHNNNVTCNIEEYFINLRKTYDEARVYEHEMAILDLALNSFPVLIQWCISQHIDYKAKDNGVDVITRWVYSWI